MKPSSSSALFFALLFSTLVAGSAPAAEGGKGPPGQSSPATGAEEADNQDYAAAEALYAAGQYAEAEKAAQALVAARTRALGAAGRPTLRARLLLAQTLGRAGQGGGGGSAAAPAAARNGASAGCGKRGHFKHPQLPGRRLETSAKMAGG